MTDDADYYHSAGAWAHDREHALRRSRRLAWYAVGGIAAIALLEGVALVLLMPLKTTATVTMLVDRTTGYTQIVDPAAPRRIRADRALLDSLLAQYVEAREEYDRATLPQAYRRVTLWSSGQARAGYIAAVDPRNPDSPALRLPQGQTVAVHIKSVSLLSPRTAMVRFETMTEAQGGGTVGARSWAAVIGFRFADGRMTAADQLVNPLGFQVTSYHRDAETLAPRDQGDVM